MNKTLLKLAVGMFLVSGLNAANAELLVNPLSKAKMGGMEGSAHFGSSSVDYEQNGSKGDVDRKFIGATIAYGMSNMMDVYGTLSYTLEAQAEGFPSDDTGFILGGGVRAKIPNNSGFDLHGYAQLLLIDEDYGSISFPGGSVSLSGEETSIMAGVVASKALDNNITVYGGLELNLLSDLDIKQNDTFFGSASVSADRDDFLGFRLGVNFNAGTFLLNVNTALIHESGIFISASQPF